MWIGRHVARATLESASQRDCDVIVLPWKGYTSTTRRLLGEVTDDTVSHATCDIVLAKLTEDALPKRLLLATAGGGHAGRGEEYVADLARFQRASLMLCSVLDPHAPPERAREEEERLAENAARLQQTAQLEDVQYEVARHRSVVAGILAAAEGYDGIVIGAADTSRRW